MSYCQIRWIRSTDQPSDDDWTEIIDIWTAILERKSEGFGWEEIDSDSFEVPVGTPPGARFREIELRLKDRNEINELVAICMPEVYE